MVHPDIVRVILGDNEGCQIPMESKFRFHGTLSGLELGFNSNIYGECELPNNTIVKLERDGQNFTIVWNSNLETCCVTNISGNRMQINDANL